MACRIAAIDAESSCGPQPKDQPPPPAAHAPNPTVVSLRPLVPRARVGSVINCMISRLALRQPFAYYARNLGGDRMTARPCLVTLMLVGTVVSAQSPAQPAAAPTATAQPAATAPPASCPEMATALTALLGRDTRMRDWAEMARYRDANKSVVAPARTDARVVFMGDSITDGW